MSDEKYGYWVGVFGSRGQMWACCALSHAILNSEGEDETCHHGCGARRPKREHAEAASRAYTMEEVREKFLAHVREMVLYWEREDRKPDVHDKLSGLAFSILSALDGCSGDIPGFQVIPSAHPDDRKYHEERGENWYPDDCDIAGGLHEHFYKREPK